ncbi:MAG: NapC/NirT family cytochrome c [Magnetospirillum sp.]|nr:NapC/NirT family cytochrome c [Magnetospirillum sp.]
MKIDNADGAGEGLISRAWAALRAPTARWSLGSILVTGLVAGIVMWGSFNWGMELTNSEGFCLSCHEMEQNVYREYRGSIHDSNRSGVRATCPDCHVPKDWIHKVRRKIQASNELFHHFLGTIDSRDKFEGKRLQLAKSVWMGMKTTDSRECRNCHNFGAFDLTRQQLRARNRHAEAEEQGKTCIDCHKGVAHQLPEGAFNAEKELNETFNAVPKK